MFTWFAGVLSVLPIQGEMRPDSPDYVLVDFEVPEGTVEFELSHEYADGEDILDWGLWSPEGFRGWGGGLRDNIIVGAAASSRGYLPGGMSEGTWTLVVGKAKVVSDSVTWAGTVTFRDAATLTPQDRAETSPVVLSNQARWYAGDFHVHSEQSGDATATFAQIHSLARESGLDFVAISDHNTVSHHGLLAAYQASVDDLLFLRAAEVTTYDGHGNALGAGVPIDFRVGHAGRTAEALVDDVNAAGGLFVINHPALGIVPECIGCGWNHEVSWSKIGAVELHTGNYDLGVTIFTPKVVELWEMAEDTGAHLAAVGGSDDHSAGESLASHESPIGYPTTLVYAEDLSEAAILEGIRQGRTMVALAGPGSPRVAVRITGNATDAEGMIGDTVLGSKARFALTIEAAMGMQVGIYQNGALAELVAIDADPFETEITLEVPVSGARYHVEVLDGGFPKLVTSHLYAQHVAPANAGCGCQQQKGRGHLAVVIVLFMMQWRLRSRDGSRAT